MNNFYADRKPLIEISFENKFKINCCKQHTKIDIGAISSELKAWNAVH